MVDLRGNILLRSVFIEEFNSIEAGVLNGPLFIPCNGFINLTQEGQLCSNEYHKSHIHQVLSDLMLRQNIVFQATVYYQSELKFIELQPFLQRYVDTLPNSSSYLER